MIVKPYMDQNCIRRAEVNPPYRLLGWYFEDDVQGSLYTCKLLFSEIEKVKAGIVPEVSGTGNAHTITITPDKVVIENEYLIESDDFQMSRTCEMPVAEFEKALTQWFEFIKVGQEDQLAWLESQRDEAETARIREQRIKRKLMESKKRRGG
jgi:hypothetical protein